MKTTLTKQLTQSLLSNPPNNSGSYRLWVICALVLLLFIGTYPAISAAETGTTTIGAPPNADVAATQGPPVATESDQEDKRRFRRARNIAVGILVVASLIGCEFALRRRLSHQISSYKSGNARSNSARLGITALKTVIAVVQRAFIVADSAATLYPMYTRICSLISLTVGISFLWPQVANLNATTIQDPVVWRFILVGSGLMLAALVSLLCVSRSNHTANDSIAQLNSEIATSGSSYLWPTMIGVVCATWVIGFQWLDIWIHFHFFWHSLSSMEAKLNFELGRTSFQEAFLEPQTSPRPGWPRRELSAACVALRAEVLNNQHDQTYNKTPIKIWTMTFLQEAGCHIMPGTQVMMEISNRFGTHWHRVALGNPAIAVEELKRIGIRHLFIDLGERDETAKTGESTSVFGCLPYSPLLSAESVRNNFTVRRLHADAFLLSLKETPKAEELPRAFADKLAGKTRTSQLGTGDMPSICSRLRDYYAKSGEQWPVNADPLLPKLKGWQ